MSTIELDFIAAGGNRHPSAADWKPGLLAFGSGNNVALWNPEDDHQKGVTTLLSGHTDVVNAVRIIDDDQVRHVITGSADKTIRIWKSGSQSAAFDQTQCLAEHQGSINVISVLPECEIVASGSADGTIKIWSFRQSTLDPIQSMPLKPRYLPLTCSLCRLKCGDILLAVGGTSTSIQLHVRGKEANDFELQAILTGHEGWIRSLDFTTVSTDDDEDIRLASASQDKYIRLWRLHNSKEALSGSKIDSSALATVDIKKSLSNRTHQVGSAPNRYCVTFEALLIGHEDWVYSARWAPTATLGSSKLLSASADNSLAIWREDEVSGVWICETRLGEISSLKGSTTATGSTGGFWIGLWQPSGDGVASLGRIGSWRRWTFATLNDIWLQQVAISGHTQEVQSVAWSPDGSYLLSTGSDQTTRLFAEWKRNGKQSWHEFARPQIHGYDLNCVDCLSPDRFISGADEKLLRVFDKPAVVDRLLSHLCGIPSSVASNIANAANVPVLGLSNKAIAPNAEDEMSNGTLLKDHDEQEEIEKTPGLRILALELEQPPFEEHLARHTLWPEHEKLYGHGYEISAVAASHDGSLVATACKASSIDHALIRIYECRDWREVKPSLTAHTLTVTSLTFSPNDQYLLSVGRDRSLAVFQRDDNKADSYSLLWSNPKAHSRMILDCTWSSGGIESIFASAGRDKAVKIWMLTEGKAECVRSISATAAVTAVAFDGETHADTLRLAYGTEEGSIRVINLAMETFEIVSELDLERHRVPLQSVNALRWRPKTSAINSCDGSNTPERSQLAVASDDSSVRIFNISR